LRLVTEIEAVPGGAIRARHTLTNLGQQRYLVDRLEVVFPLPGRVGEVLDFTGRPTAERIPQRHQIGDGLWLREGRRGHTGHDSATVLIAGVPGFTFGHGEAYGLHIAWSGNTVHRLERVPSGLGMARAEAEPDGTGGGVHTEPRERMLQGATTIGGGELLLPGEISLAEGESYATPWVYVAATRSGLDDLSAQFHGYLRSLPAHPCSPRPRQPQRLGSGLLPPRPRQAGGAGRRRRQPRRGTVRARRRLVRRTPQRPGRPRGLAGRRRRLARRVA
jgi:alpha-galactosidase